MVFKPNLNKPIKKTGLAALLEEQSDGALITKQKPFEYRHAELAVHRLRVIFDDSGSMGHTKLEDAKEGCIELMRNCVPNETAVAIHPMNHRNEALTSLTTNLPQLSVLVKEIKSRDYTPLFETWYAAIEEDPKASRFIIFSDGQPDSTGRKEACIKWCQENGVVCDTVAIVGHTIDEKNILPNSPEGLLKEIAERTGGMFFFAVNGKFNFSRIMKYLAPGLRLQLVADVQMQRDLQEGRL